MAINVVLLVISSLVALLVDRPDVVASRRSKRIAFGELMPSLDTYKMYYFVQLRKSWACLTDQTKHDELLFYCQEDSHYCGGALIHPEFVLTAAHCLMYYEVAVYEKGRVFPRNGSVDDWVRDTAGILVFEEWEKLVHAVVGFFVVPKPRHTVYSDWSLLMGSHDMFTMKQKRHVMKVFPHSVFPKDVRPEDLYRYFFLTQNSWHDVALLRACEPFKIKSGEVELAPMGRTEDELREHYESVVRQSKTCLYVGFGLQDNPKVEASKAGYPYYPENLMKHTWRSSMCYSTCNRDALARAKSRTEHSCILCSYHLGSKLGVPQGGDSGSPVTCEGRFVSTITKTLLNVKYNYTRADSYPVHCVISSITEGRLAYYKKVPYGGAYHPLNGTAWRWPFSGTPQE